MPDKQFHQMIRLYGYFEQSMTKLLSFWWPNSSYWSQLLMVNLVEFQTWYSARDTKRANFLSAPRFFVVSFIVLQVLRGFRNKWKPERKLTSMIIIIWILNNIHFVISYSQNEARIGYGLMLVNKSWIWK